MKSRFTSPGMALLVFILLAGWYASRIQTGSKSSAPKGPDRKSAESRAGVFEPAELETGPVPRRPKRPAVEKTSLTVDRLQIAAEQDGPEVLTARVETILPAGQSLVTGGYLTAEGYREFFVITPKWLEDSGGGRQIQMEAKIFKVDAAGLVSTGLESLATSERKSRQNAEIWSPDDVSRTLENTTGMDVLSTPSIVVANGIPAEIRMGGASEGYYYGLKIEAAGGPDGGFELKTEVKRIE